LAGDLAATVPGLVVDGGVLDLDRGSLTIGSGTTEAMLRALIIAGRGDYGGEPAGILSSAIADSGGRAAIGYGYNEEGVATVAFAPIGDANLDGLVDLFDLVTTEASGRYQASGGAGWKDGDFDYNGRFDVFDLLAITSSGNYATGPLSIQAVPEPATAWLAGAGGLAWVCRRWMRSRRPRR